MISASLDQISGGDYYSSNSQSVFLFTAEAEDLLPLVFRADGKTVKNVAGSAVLNVEMEYLSTGRTGVIYRMPGMDKAVKMLLDENGMPADEAERDPKDSYYSNYHPLSENPAFRFDLESIRDAEITSLSIVLPAYVARVRCFLLNAETGEWDRIEVNGNIDHPEKYLNREWQLFCRFESETYEYDTDIPTPTLSLEGREQHAEN